MFWWMHINAYVLIDHMYVVLSNCDEECNQKSMKLRLAEPAKAE